MVTGSNDMIACYNQRADLLTYNLIMPQDNIMTYTVAIDNN